MPQSSAPALSVVVPVHNGTDMLVRCLAAIAASVGDADEVIVVDDGSTDDVSRVVTEGVKSAGGGRKRPRPTVVRLDQQSGAAAARNRGAAVASRPILFFLDADVVVHGDTLERGRVLMSDSGVDAVVGSYDDTPHAATLVSRFKNLAHHYFHQRSAGPITSFWGACGLVRRERFLEVGGFDERRFSHPSIEDVELGWRLSDRGARILLDPSVQVTHLKRWTLRSLIETDVVYRAIPWVRSSLERRHLTGELNTSVMQRIAAPLAVLFFVCGLAAIPIAGARVAFLAVTLLAALINWPLFHLFWRKGGAGLLAAGFILQQMYYVWALTGLVAGVVLYWRPGRRPVSAPPARVGC